MAQEDNDHDTTPTSEGSDQRERGSNRSETQEEGARSSSQVTGELRPQQETDGQQGDATIRPEVSSMADEAEVTSDEVQGQGTQPSLVEGPSAVHGDSLDASQSSSAQVLGWAQARSPMCR